MDFLPPKLDEYIVEHTSKCTPLLEKIERETYQKVLMPRMVSGGFQGRVLSMLSKMIKPKNILEIGTFTGYSAICLAEGLDEKGTLVTIDINEELYNMVNGYFEESPFKHQIDYRIGNALNIIPELKNNFDLVFIDADKINYATYYDLIINRLNPNGYIIADNVLWSGHVVDHDRKDKETLAIKAFNKKIMEDTRVENVLFPIRDGLMICRKTD
jgi:predicted O-methyltransferase YrrM